MILDFDLTDAREGFISVYNAYRSINTNLSLSAPCTAFWRLVGGLSVFIII